MSAIPDDVWAFVSGALEEMQEQSDRLFAVTDGLMIAPESPIFDVQARTEGQLLAALSRLVGDSDEALSWFVYECDYGRQPMEAGRDSVCRVIDSHVQLRWLVELNND